MRVHVVDVALPVKLKQLIGEYLVLMMVDNRILSSQETIPLVRVEEAVREGNGATIGSANSIETLLIILLSAISANDRSQRLVEKLDPHNVGLAAVALCDLANDICRESDGIAGRPPRRSCPLA
jgi:hypothetical protein